MRTVKNIFIFFLVYACADVCAQNVTNYTFSAVAGTYTQITGSPGVTSPNLTWGSLDDGYINSIPIGFQFIYEGYVCTSLSASTNGFVKLGGTFSSNSYATNNLATGTPRAMLAPLWDDLMMNAANNISYITSGVAPNRIFTIEWNNVHWSFTAGSAGISFQVKLYESNRRIEFDYRQDAGALNFASASIGLGGFSSGNFLSLNGTGASPGASSSTETTNLSAKPATGQIYRWDHYAIKPSITSFTPGSGQYSSVVTINGSGFDAVPASDIVFFGATKATVLTTSYNSITVSVPKDLTHERITLTTLSSHLSARSGDIFDLTFGCGGSLFNGSFAANVDFSTSATYSLTMEDVDLDGKTDIIATVSGGVEIFRNTSANGVINSSSFASPVFFATSGNCSSVVFADMDGDGKPDMIAGDVSLIGEDSVCVFRNTGTPGVINAASFAPKINLEAGIYPRVTTGDIDGDGKIDIVTANAGDNNISIFRNNCTVGSIVSGSFFLRVDFPAGNNSTKAQVADIDGDGKPDVICSNGGDNTVSVFRNTATSGIITSASLASRVNFATGAWPLSIQVADLDLDGKADLVVGNNSSSANSVSFFRNISLVGTVNFTPKYDVGVANGVQGAAIGDLDGDGKPDVAVSAAYNVGVLSSLKNNSVPGSLSFISGGNYLAAVAPADIVVGDVDQDGKPDLISANGAGASISVDHNLVSNFSTIAASSVLNSISFCDDGTWKTYANPANPTEVLFAVKDNGNNLGTVTVNEYRDAAVGTYNTVHYLQRHFQVAPANQPSTVVQVRLFFTNAEFSALQTADPTIISIANLCVTKYDGPTEDGTYYPNDATSLTAIPSSSITSGSMYGGDYLQFSISSFSEFWIHGQSGVLPIELLSFDAMQNESNVDLNWSTASETNNHFFTIEKTRDGNNFETVAIVDGAGNSTSTKNYSTVDADPYPGISYYRLKQTDYNGQYSYSEFREVNFSDSHDLFSLYPDPSNGNFNIACPGADDDVVTLEIFDEQGRNISMEETTVGSVRSQKVELPDGVYSVVLIKGDERFVKKMIIY
ncbi:MAG: VCBS repeat-containing protein [Bacteroidetes bacterium]|nr:VCBS repeat-containing protein [Bacteroidota bacterium]